MEIDYMSQKQVKRMKRAYREFLEFKEALIDALEHEYYKHHAHRPESCCFDHWAEKMLENLYEAVDNGSLQIIDSQDVHP
jgi:hypothetical protein